MASLSIMNIIKSEMDNFRMSRRGGSALDAEGIAPGPLRTGPGWEDSRNPRNSTKGGTLE